MRTPSPLSLIFFLIFPHLPLPSCPVRPPPLSYAAHSRAVHRANHPSAYSKHAHYPTTTACMKHPLQHVLLNPQPTPLSPRIPCACAACLHLPATISTTPPSPPFPRVPCARAACIACLHPPPSAQPLLPLLSRVSLAPVPHASHVCTRHHQHNPSFPSFPSYPLRPCHMHRMIAIAPAQIDTWRG
ncbi:unnamed protein product, partial [Closterium sp. NIES-54]